MACHRCINDPQPEGCGDPRRCAFTPMGYFTPNNWNCGTLEALMDLGTMAEVWGTDESMQVIKGKDFGGFLVLTRYKRRGRTSSAVHVGDFYPQRALTLDVAEKWIAGTFWDEDDAG